MDSRPDGGTGSLRCPYLPAGAAAEADEGAWPYADSSGGRKRPRAGRGWEAVQTRTQQVHDTGVAGEARVAGRLAPVPAIAKAREVRVRV